MDAADFRQIAELFEALRTASAAERNARLAAADVSPAVRSEIERLLTQHAADEADPTDPLLAAGSALRDRVPSSSDDAAGRAGPRSAPAIPDRVGRFPIRGEIARGGIGVVLRAADRTIGRDVAVKILRPEFADDASMAARLEREGHLGGRLQHPGIVPVHEVGRTDDGTAYLVMRVVEGRTLAAILAEATTAAQRADRRHALLGVFEKACQAIGYAHACGVLHRDLKPSNLMVGAFGEVQVMDWGLAHEVDAPHDDRALGTPAYMAPEQARGDARRADSRLDVFGLGGILCEILTGVPPFDGHGTGTVLESARRADVGPALERLRLCDADPQLVALASACIAPDPSARPADGTEVARRVRDHLDDGERRARAAELEAAAARARATAEIRARRLSVTLGVGIVVATLAGAALWVQSEFTANERRRHASQRLVRSLLEAEAIAAGAAAAHPAALPAWEAAAAAARGASGLTVGVDDAALVERARGLVATADGHVADLRLVTTLESYARDYELVAAREVGSDADRYRAAVARFLGEPLGDVGATAAADRLASFRYPERLLRALDSWLETERILDASSADCTVIIAIANALDRDPWRRRLRRAAHSGDRAELLRLADEVDPATVDRRAVARLARHLSWVSEWGAAMRILREVRALDPGDFDVTSGLTLLLESTNNSWEFLRLATAAVAQRPTDPGANGALAFAFLESGRNADAERVARRALRLDADNLLARLALFRSLFHTGQYDAAAAEVNAIEHAVDDNHAVFPIVAGYIATSYRHHGDFETSHAWLLRLLRSPRTRVQDFAVYPLVRNLPEFTDFLRERARRGDAWDAYVIGRVLARTGDWLEALRWLERAQSTAPDLPHVDAVLANIRDTLGDVALSFGTVDAAIATLGEDVDPAAARAELVRATGRDASPTLIDYVDARLAERAGRLDDAIDGYRRILATDPHTTAPWLRWHEALVTRDGAVAAGRELTAAVAALEPEPVLPVYPGAPSASDPVERTPDGALTLRAVPSAVLGDPRHTVRRTHWQVRRVPDGDYDLAPVLDLVGSSEPTLRLPAALFERGETYAWRVAFHLSGDVRTEWSAETTFAASPRAPRAVPLDLGPIATFDVVANPHDADNDAFDEPNAFCLVTTGGLAADPSVRGLPIDGRIGVHRLMDYAGPNAVPLAGQTTNLQVELEPGSYHGIRALVSAANGNAAVAIGIVYADGVDSWRRCIVPDWFSTAFCTSLEHDSIGTPRWRGMDRIHDSGDIDERNAAALFEYVIPADPSRRAIGVLLRTSTTRLSSADAAPFLFALTAMAVE